MKHLSNFTKAGGSMDDGPSTRMTDEYRDFLQKSIGAQADNNAVVRRDHKGPVRRVKLNGARMRSGKKAHAYIARKLRFPPHYGSNLDALYDVLSTIGEPLTIIIKNTKKMCADSGESGTAILHVFRDAVHSNANLEVFEKK